MRLTYPLWGLWILSIFWGGMNNLQASPFAQAQVEIGINNNYRLTLIFDGKAYLRQIALEGDEDSMEQSSIRDLPGLSLDDSEAGLEAGLEAARYHFSKEFKIVVDGKAITPTIKLLEPESGLVENWQIQINGQFPTGAQQFNLAFPKALGPVSLTLSQIGREPQKQMLLPGERSLLLPLSILPRLPSMKPSKKPQPVSEFHRIEIALRYLLLGFEHILPEGLDHILFVLGLFFLSIKFKPLFWQVTIFTIAHTVTLALSVYGIVSLSSAVVEPLIAGSIAFIALENLMTTELKPWRPLIVFGFGLLHGLGFAGVLTELGLPRDEFVTALITFNLGVEMGQLTVISLAFLIVNSFYSHNWYRSRIAIPASVMIACMGIYWTFERIFL